MRYLKITVLAGVLGAVVGMPVFADESPVMTKSVWANNEEAILSAPVFEANELSAAFEQSAEPMQMLALSEQEMKDTEGAWIPVWAGVVGGGFNAYNTYSNGGSWGPVAYSFGTGFSGGFFASLPGGGAVLQVGKMIVGGAMAASPYPFSFR